jgi:hypothetical protein
MNKYEKAASEISSHGHKVYVVENPFGFEVWIECWSADLGGAHEFRLHENDIDEWAEIYDDNNKDQ